MPVSASGKPTRTGGLVTFHSPVVLVSSGRGPRGTNCDDLVFQVTEKGGIGNQIRGPVALARRAGAAGVIGLGASHKARGRTLGFGLRRGWTAVYRKVIAKSLIDHESGLKVALDRTSGVRAPATRAREALVDPAGLG